MRKIFIYIILVILISSCKENSITQKEILLAEDSFNDFVKYKYNLRLFSDSTYIFTYNENEFAHELSEIFRGPFVINGDSINFFPFRFEFTGSNKAVLKNNFIEFTDGKRPFRIKISKTILANKITFDTTKYSDYALFTYDSNYYNCFSGDVKAFDLNNCDLSKIDSLINLCIKQNSNIISMLSGDYLKQCIAVINSKNEKEVWINFLCKTARFSKEYDYHVIRVHDGGDCFFRLKINLSKLKYYDLIVNGRA